MSKPNNLIQMLKELTGKVDNQYKDLDVRLDNIEKVMIAQEINLKQHMQRSDHLESLLEVIKEKELKPIQRHVSQVEGIFKFLGIIALLVGLASGVLNLIKFV